MTTQPNTQIAAKKTITKLYEKLYTFRRDVVKTAIAIGEALANEKEQVGTKAFNVFVNTELPFNSRQATKYLKLYNNLELVEAYVLKDENFTLTGAEAYIGKTLDPDRQRVEKKKKPAKESDKDIIKKQQKQIAALQAKVASQSVLIEGLKKSKIKYNKAIHKRVLSFVSPDKIGNVYTGAKLNQRVESATKLVQTLNGLIH